MPDQAGYFSVSDCGVIKQMVQWWRGKAAPPIRIGGAESGIARLRVKSVQDDHLVCRTWDGTTEGTSDIKVAKPYVIVDDKK